MCLTNLLLICCFVGFAYAKTEAEVKNWFIEQGALCINDFPVTDEEFEHMHKHVVPDSKNGKCLIACIFKKVTWMDDKGMFSEDNAIKTIEQDHSDEPTKIENGKKLFALCKTEPGCYKILRFTNLFAVNDETYSGADVECERGALLAKCFIENAPKVGFKLP